MENSQRAGGTRWLFLASAILEVFCPNKSKAADRRCTEILARSWASFVMILRCFCNVNLNIVMFLRNPTFGAQRRCQHRFHLHSRTLKWACDRWFYCSVGRVWKDSGGPRAWSLTVVWILWWMYARSKWNGELLPDQIGIIRRFGELFWLILLTQKFTTVWRKMESYAQHTLDRHFVTQVKLW